MNLICVEPPIEPCIDHFYSVTFNCSECNNTNATDAGVCSFQDCNGTAITASSTSSAAFCKGHQDLSVAVSQPLKSSVNGNICTYTGCTTIIDMYKMSTSKAFCPKHLMEERFRKAKEMKMHVPDTPARSKPFQKSRLYRVNPEGKQILKAKRTDNTRQRVPSQNVIGAMERTTARGLENSNEAANDIKKITNKDNLIPTESLVVGASSEKSKLSTVAFNISSSVLQGFGANYPVIRTPSILGSLSTQISTQPVSESPTFDITSMMFISMDETELCASNAQMKEVVQIQQSQDLRAGMSLKSVGAQASKQVAATEVTSTPLRIPLATILQLPSATSEIRYVKFELLTTFDT